MVEKRIPIQVAEAVERVMKYAKHGEVEEISITESYGRILGEDVVSDHDVPHFDRSPYDGFAIRAEDTKEATQENPVGSNRRNRGRFCFTEEVGSFRWFVL